MTSGGLIVTGMTNTMPVAAPTRPLTPTVSEQELVALKRQDPAACERLVREQTPRMLCVARRILRDPEAARDTVQEAWSAAFAHIGSFDGRARVSTWLHRIVVNAALMRLRSRAARPEVALESLPGFEPDGGHRAAVPEWGCPPDERIDREQRRRLVREEIDRLPESYRTVLLLRDIEELDTEDTARILGLSRGAVKVRLHRARQALRGRLETRLSLPPA